MEDRRNFLTMLAALAAAAPELEAQTSGGFTQTRSAGVIPLPPPFDKQTASFTELYVEPGKKSKAHKHPGFVLGYVIEGEYRFQITGQPERILKAGDIFFEPPGVTHLLSESASADKPARVLAIVIAETGKPLTGPA